MSAEEREPCPSCGGAGGGPFGRAASAWDDEDYVCPRCEGLGMVLVAHETDAASQRPGLVKTAPVTADAERVEKKKATG